MSVDTVNYALTCVRLRVEKMHPDTFIGGDTWDTLLTVCNNIRKYLIQENIKGVNLYINSILADKPDIADFILGELFEELDFPDGTREDLDSALASN